MIYFHVLKIIFIERFHPRIARRKVLDDLGGKPVGIRKSDLRRLGRWSVQEGIRKVLFQLPDALFGIQRVMQPPDEPD